MNRVLTVARMQMINKQTFIVVPLIVLAGALAVCLMLFWVIPSDDIKAGGAQAPLWYFLVVGIQALTLTFPFSQAMSITRREFFLGTLVAAGATASMLTVLFVVGGFIEKGLDGYGGNNTFFLVPTFWDDGWAAAGLIHFVIAMAFFLVGFTFATVYKRFGPTILTTALISVSCIALLGVWLITHLEAWNAVGDWMASNGALGLALWGIPVLAAMCLGSYGLLRRAVP